MGRGRRRRRPCGGRCGQCAGRGQAETGRRRARSRQPDEKPPKPPLKRQTRAIWRMACEQSRTIGSTIVTLAAGDDGYCLPVGGRQPRLSAARRQAAAADPRPQPGAEAGRLRRSGRRRGAPSSQRQCGHPRCRLRPQPRARQRGRRHSRRRPLCSGQRRPDAAVAARTSWRRPSRRTIWSGWRTVGWKPPWRVARRTISAL